MRNRLRALFGIGEKGTDASVFAHVAVLVIVGVATVGAGVALLARAVSAPSILDEYRYLTDYEPGQEEPAQWREYVSERRKFRLLVPNGYIVDEQEMQVYITPYDPNGPTVPVMQIFFDELALMMKDGPYTRSLESARGLIVFRAFEGYEWEHFSQVIAYFSYLPDAPRL